MSFVSLRMDKQISVNGILAAAVVDCRSPSMPPSVHLYRSSVTYSLSSSITVQWRYCWLNKSLYNKSLSPLVHLDDDDCWSRTCTWIIMSSPHNNIIEDGHTEYDQKPTLFKTRYTYTFFHGSCALARAVVGKCFETGMHKERAGCTVLEEEQPLESSRRRWMGGETLVVINRYRINSINK